MKKRKGLTEAGALLTVGTVFLPLAGRKLAAATTAKVNKKMRMNRIEKEREHTFTVRKDVQMVVNAATESVDLRKIIRKRESGELLVKVRNGGVDSEWDFEEERMVDELDIIVEW